MSRQHRQRNMAHRPYALLPLDSLLENKQKETPVIMKDEGIPKRVNLSLTPSLLTLFFPLSLSKKPNGGTRKHQLNTWISKKTGKYNPLSVFLFTVIWASIFHRLIKCGGKKTFYCNPLKTLI